MRWTRGKTKEEIENEAYRIITIWCQNGDIDVVQDLIPLATQKNIINEWHDEDELDGNT